MTKVTRSIGYLRAGVIALMLISGILSGCAEPNYNPATIEFTSPHDGHILPPGTESVTIEGYVEKGDGNVKLLVIPKKTFPFFNLVTINKDLTFKHKFKLDPDAIYSTCTFQVIDSNWVANHGRISFAVGESKPWDDDGVDDGIKLSLTEDGLNDVVGDLLDTVNDWKNALIYGVDGFHHPDHGFIPGCPDSSNQECRWFVEQVMDMLEPPFIPLGITLLPLPWPAPDIVLESVRLRHTEKNPSIKDSILPIEIVKTGNDFYIDPEETDYYKGHLDIGKIGLGNTPLDIKPDGVVVLDLKITAESEVNPESHPGIASLYAYGYRSGGSEPHFMVLVKDDISFDDPITAKIDTNEFGISIIPIFSEAKLHLEKDMIDLEFGGTKPDWLLNMFLKGFEPFVHDILRTLANKVFNPGTGSILTFDTIGLDLEGVNFNISPMPAPTIVSNDDLLAARLHVNPMPESLINPLNINYLTTDSTAALGEGWWFFANLEQQLLLAVNDDVLNKTLYSIFQSGLLHEYDITDLTQEFLGDSSNEDLKVSISLTVPPVCDFSGTDGSEFGKIIVPNMIIDITNLIPLPEGEEHWAKVSVDLEASLKIAIDDEGDIVGGIDKETSNAVITILYENYGNTGILPSIGTQLANELINSILEEIIDEVILSIVNNLKLGIDDIEGELVDNYLYLKIN